jgi:DNA polymerase I-like protein with 3'-5' exonuclease and polymerase domains
LARRRAASLTIQYSLVPHAVEYRHLSTGTAGETEIADYSQSARILAGLQRSRFHRAFNSGADLHRLPPRRYSTFPSIRSAEQRDFAKRLNFGVVWHWRATYR